MADATLERIKKLKSQLTARNRKKMPLMLKAEKYKVLANLYHTSQDFTNAHKTNKAIIQEIRPSLIRKDKDVEERKQLLIILRDAYTYCAREDFECFLVAMEWNRPPEKRFYGPRKERLSPVVHEMQRLADGELDVLAVSMPPRVGKTTLSLLYLLWRGGRNPNKAILSAGYSSALVNSFYDGCLEFINSPEYRFLDIFPSSPLISTSAKNLTLDLGERRRYRTLTFRSIDGSVTGATEASDLLYLDDLVSGIEEARNINRLDTLWEKVSSDMLQRKKDNVPMLIIGTRWSIHDPLGRIEAKYDGDERAKFMTLSAVDEFGHSNFDYEYGVGYGTKHYANLKSMTDPVTWECVYQQNPIERDGLLFTELERFLEIPKDPPDDIFAFVDVAFGGDDFLSMPIAYQWGDDVYIVDCVFLKGGYSVTEPIVAGYIKRHGIKRVVFEANNGGDFYSRDISKMLKDDGIHCNILALRAPGKSGKLSRIIQHAPAVKEWYFRDQSLYSSEEYYGVFMGQLLSFVQTGKSKHDDAPDSCAGLASMMRKYTVQAVKFSDRRSVGL